METSIKFDTHKELKWQMVRGICILAVILIHCPNAIDYPYQSPEFISWISIRQLINFPVAVFIFLAGFFTKPEKVNKIRNYYHTRGGCKLLIPYLIWSVIYSIITISDSVISNSEINWQRILVDCIFGKASGHLYYIVVLLQLVLLTPLIIQWIENIKIRIILFSITPLWVIFLYVYNIINQSLPSYYHMLFPAWIGFYVLGLTIRRFGFDKQHISVYLVVSALLIELFDAYLILKLGGTPNFACSQIRLGAFLYSSFVIIFVLTHNLNLKYHFPYIQSFLVNAGNNSYGIFFVHMVFIRIGKMLCTEFRIKVWIIQFVIVFIITLSFSLLFINVVRKLCIKTKNQNFLNYIGF